MCLFLSKERVLLFIGGAIFVLFLVFLINRNTDEPPDDVSGYQPAPPVVFVPYERPSEIPDMIAGNPLTPVHGNIDIQNLSPTILSSGEVWESVEEVLYKLIRLDSSVLYSISYQSVGGHDSPFYFMIMAAIENQEIADAFRHLGSATSFRAIGYEQPSMIPNGFIFYLEVTTPYVSDLITALTIPEIPSFITGLGSPHTSFAGSGAARAIAELDLETVPMTTDIVLLTVLVIDDEPIIFHPVSINHGSRIPQYAFLWGGAKFVGIQDGDLLLDNHFGNMREVSREEFLAAYVAMARLFGHGEDVLAYIADPHRITLEALTEGLGYIQRNDWDALPLLMAAGTPIGQFEFFDQAMADFQMLSDGVLDHIVLRGSTLEYSFRYFISDIFGGGIIVVYSVIDPDTGNRVYFSEIVTSIAYFDFTTPNGSFLVRHALESILMSVTTVDTMLVAERFTVAGHLAERDGSPVLRPVH